MDLEGKYFTPSDLRGFEFSKKPGKRNNYLWEKCNDLIRKDNLERDSKLWGKAKDQTALDIDGKIVGYFDKQRNLHLY